MSCVRKSESVDKCDEQTTKSKRGDELGRYTTAINQHKWK